MEQRVSFLRRIINPFRPPKRVMLRFGDLVSQPLPYNNGIIQQDFLGRSLAPKILYEDDTLGAIELEGGGHLIGGERGNPPASFND